MENLGTIESVSDFLSKTEGVHYHNKEETRFFCRGQSSMQLVLRPKIGRYKYTSPVAKVGEPTWLRNFNSMFSQFEREYVTHHPNILGRKIDRITLAQHYGLATQLLDWTLNPLIALFFACESKSNEDGIVFIFMPGPSPNILEDSDMNSTISWQTLRPIRLDQRMINQDTAFTFHGDPTLDFVERLGDRCNGVLVPANNKPFILQQLSSIGIHKAFVYPGLSTICERIDSAYRGMYSFPQNMKHYPEEKDMADERKPYLTRK